MQCLGSTLRTLMTAIAGGALLALLLGGGEAIPLGIALSAYAGALLLGLRGLRELWRGREPRVAPITAGRTGNRRNAAPETAREPADAAPRTCADREQVIRRAREARLWTQEELFARSGVSERAIRRVEAGEQVSFETLRALSAALDLDSRRFSAGNADAPRDDGTSPTLGQLMNDLLDVADSPNPVIAIITAAGATDVTVGPDRPGRASRPEPGSPACGVVRALGLRAGGSVPAVLGTAALAGPLGAIRLADGRWAALAELAPATGGPSDDARLPDALAGLAVQPLAIVRRLRPLPTDVARRRLAQALEMQRFALDGDEATISLTAADELIAEGNTALVRQRIDVWFAGDSAEDAVAAADTAVTRARAAGCRLTRVRHSALAHWPGHGWIGQPAASGHVLAQGLLRAAGRAPGPAWWIPARPLLLGAPPPTLALTMAAYALFFLAGAGILALVSVLCSHAVLCAAAARDPWFDTRLIDAERQREGGLPV